MSYKIRFQRNDAVPPSYQYDKYGTGTIHSSACGPSTLVNCLFNQGIADVTIPAMCSVAVNCGARIPNQGTDEKTLLKAASEKYGFTYRSTSKNAELVAHLKAGGTAVCWTGGEASPSYPLFSNSGHFIAAIDVDSSGMIVIADSLYYSAKWTSTALRRAQIHPTGQTGIVTCSITALGKATANRTPSYFLIFSKDMTKTTITKPEEETEMIEKTKFNIDGTPVQMNAITKDGTTFVCLREYNNALGLNTDYDAENSTRTVSPSNVKLNLDGNVTEVAGMMMGERNFVAVRDAFEVAGYTVDWSAAEKTVLLKKVQ